MRSTASLPRRPARRGNLARNCASQHTGRGSEAASSMADAQFPRGSAPPRHVAVGSVAGCLPAVQRTQRRGRRSMRALSHGTAVARFAVSPLRVAATESWRLDLRHVSVTAAAVRKDGRGVSLLGADHSDDPSPQVPRLAHRRACARHAGRISGGARVRIRTLAGSGGAGAVESAPIASTRSQPGRTARALARRRARNLVR